MIYPIDCLKADNYKYFLEKCYFILKQEYVLGYKIHSSFLPFSPYRNILV